MVGSEVGWKPRLRCQSAYGLPEEAFRDRFKRNGSERFRAGQAEDRGDR